MKKSLYLHTYLLRICVCMVPASISFMDMSAAPDCLDNSWHLEQKHDFKEYHLVSMGKQACTHDCYNDRASIMTSNRGYCTVCRHYHVPRPYIIVSQKDQKTVTPVTPAIEKKKIKKAGHILAQYLQHS